MVCLVFGSVGFLLFYLYEIQAATNKFAAFRPFFFIGVVLMAAATVWAGAVTVEALGIVVWRLLIFGVIALLLLGLLIYTLFFAIPFAKTYVATASKAAKGAKTPVKKVCKTGMYALCRHPGVLWFCGFYLFSWLALGGQLLFWQFVVYSFLNLLYVIIQDNWSFLKCFVDYEKYKKEVPFLIPNLKSIKCCLKTFKAKRGGA